MFCLYSQRAFYRRMELIIESFHDRSPLYTAFCDLVKVLFYACRKVEIKNIREVFSQEVIDYRTDIRRVKL